MTLSLWLDEPGRKVPSTGKLAMIALIGYFVQVAFFGPTRYFLSQFNIELLWYLPDMLGLACIAAILMRDIYSGSARVAVFLGVIFFYMVGGYTISDSVNSVLSTFKALVPLFCGLLLDRDVLTRRFMKWTLLCFLLLACAGVAYSKYVGLPWLGLEFQGVGVVQQFKQLQWVAGGDVRLYGFAGDQHGAGFSIVALLILLSMSLRKYEFYALAVLSLGAILLTTSRTALLCFFTFVAIHSAANLRSPVDVQPLLKRILRISFIAPAFPIIVIGIALLFDAGDVPYSLESLWMRGTYTWLVIFTFMEELAPSAMLHGFGLGGFGFGLLQSDLARYYTPVDNFIMFNYLCFGLPYVAFYIYQCRRMTFERDPYRVAIFVMLAVYGLTLRGWSDYLFMILFGFSAACVFVGTRGELEQATRSKGRALWRLREIHNN